MNDGIPLNSLPRCPPRFPTRSWGGRARLKRRALQHTGEQSPFRARLGRSGQAPTQAITDHHQPYIKAVQQVAPSAEHIRTGLGRLTGHPVGGALRAVARGEPPPSLGRAFARVARAWGIPEARLAHPLGVSPADLARLAGCRLPPAGSPGFDDRLDAVATTFGIPRWRLDFVCRAALRDPPRLRE